MAGGLREDNAPELSKLQNLLVVHQDTHVREHIVGHVFGEQFAVWNEGWQPSIHICFGGSPESKDYN